MQTENWNCTALQSVYSALNITAVILLFETGKTSAHQFSRLLADRFNDSIFNFNSFQSSSFYFVSSHGSYLSPIGSKAVLKSRSQSVTRDELFSLEDSLPQASFVAALNLKYVSVKQGVDVTANQDEIGTDETFQLEYDWSARRWALRTTQVSNDYKLLKFRV